LAPARTAAKHAEESVNHAGLLFEHHKWYLLATDPPRDIDKGPPSQRAAIQHRNLATVGGRHDRLVVGHYTKQIDRQNLEHIFNAHHLAAADHTRLKAIEDQAWVAFLERLT